MGPIDVTVWTVMQGDESSAYLVQLDINKDQALETFTRQAEEIEAGSPQTDSRGGMSAHAGCDWVRLEPRIMRAAVADLLDVLRQPAQDLITRCESDA